MPGKAAVFFRWIRDGLEMAAFGCVFFAVSRLPRRLFMGFSDFLGRLAFHVARNQRRVALANLDLAFGESMTEEKKRAVALASFRSCFRAILDFAWFSRHTASRLERLFRFDDSFETYRQLSPVIVVTAHFGNWELLGQAGALDGHPAVSVAAMLPNERINRFVTKLRERNGLVIVPREGAIRVLLKTLREGGRVALLMDQNTRLSEGGVFVRFFGKPVTMSSAAALLSVRTGAPIVPVFSLTLPDGSYRGYVGPVLRPGADGNAMELNQRIADSFEAEIRKHPEQWLWMYRRWKYVPPSGRPEDFPFYAHEAT
ncbi:MAG: lysophospholipid acyltransferase family protein [Kiritimatiellia bacterium]